MHESNPTKIAAALALGAALDAAAVVNQSSAAPVGLLLRWGIVVVVFVFLVVFV